MQPPRAGRTSSRASPKSAAAILAMALFLPVPLLAQDLTGHFDDWILMADDSIALALTTDGENTAFGLVCGPDCQVYIEAREPCAEGREYPTRIEAGTGAYSVTFACEAEEGGPLLVMPYDERFQRLIAGQKTVGFTVTREDGQSSVFRFPLAGSEKAIGLALAAHAYIKPLDAAGLGRIAGPANPEPSH